MYLDDQHNCTDSRKCARTFSDIQIFTGIAILVSGFKAFACGLQLYHWQLVIYMGWLASFTHASILSALRNHLRNHPQQLWWRFGGMCTMVVLLIVAIILTPAFVWQNELYTETDIPVTSAICHLTEPFHGESLSLQSRIKLVFFIIYGYVVRILKMSRKISTKLRVVSFKLQRKSSRIQYGHEGTSPWNPHSTDVSWKKRTRILLIDPLQIALLRLFHLHLDILASFLGEV